MKINSSNKYNIQYHTDACGSGDYTLYISEIEPGGNFKLAPKYKNSDFDSLHEIEVSRQDLRELARLFQFLADQPLMFLPESYMKERLESIKTSKIEVEE